MKTSTVAKTVPESPILTDFEAIILLSLLRGFDLRPYLKDSVYFRFHAHFLRKYGIDISLPPTKEVYNFFWSRGAECVLWPYSEHLEVLL